MKNEFILEQETSGMVKSQDCENWGCLGKFWPDPGDCLLYHYGSKEEINTASQKASSCKMKNMIGRSEENRQGWERAWLPGLRPNNDPRIRTWEQRSPVSQLLALGRSVSWANKRLLQVTSGGGQRRPMCWPQQAVCCQPAQKHIESWLLTPNRPFILGNPAHPPKRKPFSVTGILPCPSTVDSALHSPWPDFSGKFSNFRATRKCF